LNFPLILFHSRLLLFCTFCFVQVGYLQHSDRRYELQVQYERPFILTLSCFPPSFVLTS
jgi:hypothetical protein